jgi:CrcB protein
MLLILVGGGIGSCLRYWLPTLSASPSFGVLVGGAVGSYLRYWLSRWFNSRPWGQAFPYGTLVINVSGSFILALAALLILEGLPAQHHWWYLWIGTGFCGGFTTFSTFEWETFKLVRDGSHNRALANLLGSLVAGFLAVVLAAALARVVMPGQPQRTMFPYATLVINVSGSFILAAAAVIILERLSPAHQGWYLLIGTGFCGGYTTFSTFEWETFQLVRDGAWAAALGYAFGSLLAGFAGVLLAVTLVNGFLPKR